MLCFSFAILFYEFIKPFQLTGIFCAVEYTPTHNVHATPEFATKFTLDSYRERERPCRAKSFQTFTRHGRSGCGAHVSRRGFEFG
jgi:hypothetical protein